MRIHTLPIKFKKHAALRLIQRFDMSLEDVKHFFKTGKMIKKPEKNGDIGIIQRSIGDAQIRFIFTIRKKTIWIITIEGGD